MAWLNFTMSNQTVKNGLKRSNCSKSNFSSKTTHKIFMYLSSFHSAKFQKNLTADLELWGCTIFGPKTIHFPQTKNFLETVINMIFIYLLPTFIGQNFKKILTVDPGPLAEMRFFSENLLKILVPFIPAYQHVKNLSQILIY